MTSPRFLAGAACALLLAACATPSRPPVLPLPAAAAAMPAGTPPATVLLVSIDGLRADAVTAAQAPNLTALAAGGVRARWMTPSYPSLTFPNHYTLVTGLRPDHHGIVNNAMRDDALGEFSLTDRQAVGDGRWWGGQPLWVGVIQAGARAYTWSWPGSEAAIDGVRPTRWQPFDARVPIDARVDQVLGWLREPPGERPRLATLYFDQVDHAGHEHGPQSPEYAQAVREVDAGIGRLVRGLHAAGLEEAVDVVVVSDHGMATVPAGQVIAVTDMVPATVAAAVSPGQSVGFRPLPGREADAERALLGRHAHYACWRRGQLPARWHYGTDPRIPPIVCQMDEGWDAVKPDLAARRLAAGTVRGSHGYDPALPSMRAVFIARGPSFARGLVLPGFDNVDVYPLLARLLQVPAARNDGDPDRLLPALTPSLRGNAAAGDGHRGGKKNAAQAPRS